MALCSVDSIHSNVFLSGSCVSACQARNVAIFKTVPTLKAKRDQQLRSLWVSPCSSCPGLPVSWTNLVHFTSGPLHLLYPIPEAPQITKGLALLFGPSQISERGFLWPPYFLSQHEDDCSTPIHPHHPLPLYSAVFILTGLFTMWHYNIHTHIHSVYIFFILFVISANVSSRKDFVSLCTVILRAWVT